MSCGLNFSVIEATKRGRPRAQSNGAVEVWKAKHESVRQKNGIEHQLPWSMGLPELIGKSARTRDIIDLGYTILKSLSTPEPEDSVMFIDTSQCATRSPWCLRTVNVLTTSTELFSYGARRYLIPREYFRLMGFEGFNPGSLSPSCQKDLMGEGMSIPCIGLVLYALATSMPTFWERC